MFRFFLQLTQLGLLIGGINLQLIEDFELTQDQLAELELFKRVDRQCYGERYSSDFNLVELVGGFPPEPNRFPYMVSLQFPHPFANGSARYAHWCGGTLIADSLILTAAHCVYAQKVDFRNKADSGKDVGRIRDGELFATLNPYCRHLKGDERRQVVKYYINDSYQGNALDGGDIAILQVDTPFSYDGPFANYEASLNIKYENYSFYTTVGWGAQNSSETRLETFMESVRPIQAGLLSFRLDDYCQNALQDQFLTQEIDLQSMACFQYEGVDTCFGDSGGPVLVADGQYGMNIDGNPANDIQVAIASWGPDINCAGLSGLPGIYTNLQFYVDWINGIVDKAQGNIIQKGIQVQQDDLIPNNTQVLDSIDNIYTSPIYEDYDSEKYSQIVDYPFENYVEDDDIDDQVVQYQSLASSQSSSFSLGSLLQEDYAYNTSEDLDGDYEYSTNDDVLAALLQEDVDDNDIMQQQSNFSALYSLQQQVQQSSNEEEEEELVAQLSVSSLRAPGPVVLNASVVNDSYSNDSDYQVDLASSEVSVFDQQLGSLQVQLMSEQQPDPNSNISIFAVLYHDTPSRIFVDYHNDNVTNENNTLPSDSQAYNNTQVDSLNTEGSIFLQANGDVESHGDISIVRILYRDDVDEENDVSQQAQQSIFFNNTQDNKNDSIVIVDLNESNERDVPAQVQESSEEETPEAYSQYLIDVVQNNQEEGESGEDIVVTIMSPLQKIVHSQPIIKQICILDQDVMYSGEVTESVEKSDSGECCSACLKSMTCDMYVYCNDDRGCVIPQSAHVIPYKQCDLKRYTMFIQYKQMDVLDLEGSTSNIIAGRVLGTKSK